MKSVIRFEVAATYLAELRAEHDEFERPTHSAFAGLEPGDQGVDQRLIGKLHGPPEGITEQLTAELAEEVVAPLRDEVIAQTV